jgi:hypothetical protein
MDPRGTMAGQSKAAAEIDYFALRRRAGNFRSVVNLALSSKSSALRTNLEQRVSAIESLIENRDPGSLQKARDDFDVLEREFAATLIYPAKKRKIVWVWVVALAAMILVHLLLGPDMLLHRLYKAEKWVDVTGPLVGHFLYYMPFRYVLYGAILGSALILTIRNLRIEFDNYHQYGSILNAPVVNFILTVAVAYVFLQLVKAKAVSFAVFGLTLSTEQMDGTAVLLATIGISLAAEKYAKRLVEMTDVDGQKSRSGSPAEPQDGRAHGAKRNPR